jgi:hypothetical protein
MCESLNPLHFPIFHISCRSAFLILCAIICFYSRRFMAPALSIVLTVKVLKYFSTFCWPNISRWLLILKFLFRFRSIWCSTEWCQPLSHPTWKIRSPYLWPPETGWPGCIPRHEEAPAANNPLSFGWKWLTTKKGTNIIVIFLCSKALP